MPYDPDMDTAKRRRKRAAIYNVEMRTGLLPALRVLSRSDHIPFGIRERMVSTFCSPEYSSSLPFEVGFFGMKYTGDLSRYVDWCVYFFGAYEKRALFFLRDLLRERNGAVFVDIGANVGQHSLFMSKWARKVHAFEPWDVVRRSIEQKIEDNKLTNVTVHPFGLGEKHEWLPYYAPLGSNLATGSFEKTHATDRNRLLGSLELVNGDEYFEAHGISDIDLIKIDAEGWEFFVLLGLQNTLAKAKPTVFVEISETTLQILQGPEKLRQCLPDCYEAVYVEFTRKGIEYSRFDGSKPGDVLLRVTGP
jgi:FkbM family methyltransferase